MTNLRSVMPFARCSVPSAMASKPMNSADSFLRALDPLRHGCVVADVRMPGMDGIELVRELARRQLPLPVVVISGHADVPMAVAAIKVRRRGLYREAD